MKLVVLLSGSTASMTISIGLLLKMVRLPGGNELMTIGLTLLGLLFLPCMMLFIYRRINARPQPAGN